jgi:hypothetical protein
MMLKKELLDSLNTNNLKILKYLMKLPTILLNISTKSKIPNSLILSKPTSSPEKE